MALRACFGISTAIVLLAVMAFSGSPTRAADVPATPAAPERYALLVGVNDYAQPSDSTYAVQGLKGPENDVALIKELLVKPYQFKDDTDHILTLTGKNATHAAIRAAFQSQLIAKATQHPGAIVVFYFSGHGSQVNLKGANPLDTRWHDTLLAYDSRADGGSDIIDDELIAWFDELKKYTPNITFILDSCHSGSELKNVDTLISRAVPPNPHQGVQTAPGGNQIPAGPDFGLPRRKEFVLLSASLDYESSYEDQIEVARGVKKYHGFFTYYLDQALSLHPDITNDAAIREVAQALTLKSPNQHPQAVGNIEGKVLGGAGEGDDPYVAITSVGPGGTFELNVGMVQGLRKGAFLAVYAPTVHHLSGETGKLANARIAEVSGFTATAQLTDKPKQPLSKQDKVAVVTPFFGFDVLSVRLYDFPNRASTPDERHILDDVRAGLAKNQLATIVAPGKPWAVGVQKDGCVINGRVFAATDKRSKAAGCSREYYLTGAKGDVPLLGFHVAPADPTAAQKIVDRIEQLAKQANIRALDNAQSPLNGQAVLRLYPVKVKLDKAGKPEAIAQGDPINDGYQGLKIDSKFRLKVDNNSDQYLYCAVLMLGTSGRIELVTVNPYGDPIAPHSSELFPPRDVGPPLGIETYKLIATTSKGVDFRVMDQPGASKGVNDSPLQWLLNQTTNMKTKDSSASADVNLNDWTTAALDVLVEDK